MNNGVHFMAVEKARTRLAQIEEEYTAASTQLDEAIKMGDLSENAEYEIAKAAVQKLIREREDLSSVMGMSLVKANDNIKVIEEGSIIHLVIYDIVNDPAEPGTEEFKRMKDDSPVFDGVMMYGATLPYQELLTDNALSADTPVGKFLLGKQPGDYCIPVPAGFAIVTAEKLKTSTSPDALYCTL